MRDLWHLYGSGTCWTAPACRPENDLDKDHEPALALAICTAEGATAMNLERYGTPVGDETDAVLVEARTVPEAVVLCPLRKRVLKRGRVVARDGRPLIEAP